MSGESGGGVGREGGGEGRTDKLVNTRNKATRDLLRVGGSDASPHTKLGIVCVTLLNLIKHKQRYKILF